MLAPAGISSLGANDVALQSNGKIVVVGTSTSASGDKDMFVARYNPNGTLDTSFGGGSGYVRLDIDGNATITSEQASGVAIQSDGKIVVAGTARAEVAGVGGIVLVARFNSDGTRDLTFGPSGFKLGTPLPNTGYHYFVGGAVALQSDGSIIVAGIDNWSFVIGQTDGSTIGTNPHPLLMRFLPTQSEALQAAGGAASVSCDTDPLTMSLVQPLLTEAITRWQAIGVDVSKLGSLDIRITDLPDATLGLASGNTIWLDDNAAGWGWFVDATPKSDSEFTDAVDQGEQNRMDLLSALVHEVGHLLGVEHSKHDDNVMFETLAAGERSAMPRHHDLAMLALAADFDRSITQSKRR